MQAVITARDERRRQGLEVLVRRATAGPPRPGPARDAVPGLRPEEAVRALLALTSFESFDAMAGADRDLGAVVPLVTGLAGDILSRVAQPGG